MRKNFPLTLGVLGLTAMLAACSNNSTPVSSPEVSAPAEHQIASMGALKYVQNEVVVGYENQASLDAAVKAMGGTLLRAIPEIKVALVQVSGDALKVAGRAKVDGVRYASPNAVVMPERETPTLGSASLSAQAANPDQIFDALPQYALDPRHLNAKAAWDKGLTGKGVTVAVIDDPGDVTHPDLAANWAGKAFDPRQNKVYTDGQAWKAYVQKPDNDHGTFVASSIVASKNGKGIVGVAYDAKWMPVIMFNPGSYSSFEIALGAVWATNNGARAINNSWGGGISFGPVKDAFDYAMASGTTVVASMGNTYHDEAQYPAALPGVIASGALDASNRKVTFSTGGRHISTGAPGQDTMLVNPTWQDTKPEGGYALISGTSFSSPYTTGVAALILQKCPNATPYQVRRVMEMNADSSIGSNPTGFDRDTGWGRLDAGKIAQNLTDCAALPAKGANAKINVSYISNTNGVQEGVLGDVILRGKGLRPGATDDSTPMYWSPTNNNGEVRFSEIAPGDYDIYVAGPDLSVTGGKTEDRGTFIGTFTATSGSTYARPDEKTVILPAAYVSTNPEDPYEPNDTLADAKTIKYGETTQTAYIYGKPADMDFFAFTGAAGDSIKAEMQAAGQVGGQLDAYLFLLDSTGQVLAENDDRGTPRIDSDSEINFTLPAAGKYYLVATSYDIAEGGSDNNPFNKYRLKLSKTN